MKYLNLKVLFFVLFFINIIKCQDCDSLPCYDAIKCIQENQICIDECKKDLHCEVDCILNKQQECKNRVAKECEDCCIKASTCRKECNSNIPCEKDCINESLKCRFPPLKNH